MAANEIPAPHPTPVRPLPAPYRPWNIRPINAADRAYLRSEILRTSGA